MRCCLATATGPPGGSQTSGFNPDSSCNNVSPNFPNYHSSTGFDTFPLANNLFNSILTPISFLIFHRVPINIYDTYNLISHSSVVSHTQSNKDSCIFRNYTIINNNSSSQLFTHNRNSIPTSSHHRNINKQRNWATQFVPLGGSSSAARRFIVKTQNLGFWSMHHLVGHSTPLGGSWRFPKMRRN